VQFLDDETETKEKDEVEKEMTSGVTNINMDDETEAEKKKTRRRTKKKETKVNEPESKEKKQTNPPSVPIHELFPTSNSPILKQLNEYKHLICVCAVSIKWPLQYSFLQYLTNLLIFSSSLKLLSYFPKNQIFVTHQFKIKNNIVN